MRMNRRVIAWTVGAVFALHASVALLAACTGRDHEMVTRDGTALEAAAPASTPPTAVDGRSASALDTLVYKPDARYLPPADSKGVAK